MENTTAKPKVKLIGEDSNVFKLLGICSRALKNAGQADQSKEMSKRVMACENYNVALQIMMEYCDVS